MGYLGRQRSYRAPPSSGRRLSLRDADDGLGPHPSNSRHGSLLSAAGLAARENEHALRSSSRRSPAAHTKRSMSRAALAEEKIRLLDGIGGYAPHGSVPSRRDGASSSSSRGWGFGQVRPLRGPGGARVRARRDGRRGRIAFPEIVTAGRYALSGTIARAIAARHRINAAAAEPQPGASASTGASETPAAEFADESCVRLVAGDAGVSSELLALVHAAKRLRESGTRVVWDYADAAATCPCGELVRSGSDASGDDAARRSSFSSARRLLRLSASSPKRARRAGPRARPTTAGPRCSPATRARSRTRRRRLTILRAARKSAPSAKKTEAERGEDADASLVVGARNAMCEEMLGAWVLSPAMRAEVDAATKKLGGDLGRVVAFHVGGETKTEVRAKSAARAYDADVEKETRRLAAFVRERAESGPATSPSRGWAEKAAKYEAEVNAEEEAIEEEDAEGASASTGASEKTASEKTELPKRNARLPSREKREKFRRRRRRNPRARATRASARTSRRRSTTSPPVEEEARTTPGSRSRLGTSPR